MINIPRSQIPESLIARIAETLHLYSTALLKIPFDGHGFTRPLQIGSGTFVSIGRRYGILTAQHVAKALDGPFELGLALINDEHAPRIKKDHLDIIEIASATIPSEGPDLSFICLAPPDVNTIKAVKSFLDLSIDKDDAVRNPPSLDSGNWFIVGTPGELTGQEESEKGFQGAISFNGMCYFTSELREYARGDYDYIEVDVGYGGSADVPKTFRGMSGGSLWQVFIRQSDEGVLELRKYLLSGVIFYESPVNNQHRFIRCHGRRSIYEHVYATVEKCQ